MFNWLFGKSEPEKKQAVPQNQKKWKYQALLQFLVSKEWKVTILNFIDNNCLVFDNQQQNKFEYTIIHNKFKELVAGLFDSMMTQLGLDQELLLELIEKGLKSTVNNKVFEQLLYIDDFLKFKSMMLKRNAKLEEQALNQLSKSNVYQSNFNYSGISSQQNNQVFQKAKEKQKEQGKQSQQQMIKRIMEMSIKQQEERKRLQESIDKEEQNKVKNAIKQSKILQSKMLSQKAKQQEILKNAQKQSELQKMRLDKLNDLKEKKQKLEQKRRQQEQLLLEKQLQRQKQQQQQQQERQRQEKRRMQKNRQLQAQKLQKQEGNNKHLDPQTIEERKRRLLQQRQILRKKKMQERNQQIEKNDGKQVQTILLGQVLDSKIVSKEAEQEQKIPQSEIERRRELMKKIKNKIVEDY